VGLRTRSDCFLRKMGGHVLGKAGEGSIIDGKNACYIKTKRDARGCSTGRVDLRKLTGGRIEVEFSNLLGFVARNRKEATSPPLRGLKTGLGRFEEGLIRFAGKKRVLKENLRGRISGSAWYLKVVAKLILILS